MRKAQAQLPGVTRILLAAPSGRWAKYRFSRSTLRSSSPNIIASARRCNSSWKTRYRALLLMISGRLHLVRRVPFPPMKAIPPS